MCSPLVKCLEEKKLEDKNCEHSKPRKQQVHSLLKCPQARFWVTQPFMALYICYYCKKIYIHKTNIWQKSKECQFNNHLITKISRKSSLSDTVLLLILHSHTFGKEVRKMRLPLWINNILNHCSTIFFIVYNPTVKNKNKKAIFSFWTTKVQPVTKTI